MRSSRLLIDEYPLEILPSLAVAIGLNEAVFVQQLHYWLKKKEATGDERFFRDGRWWTYNTYPEWHRQFPFWSIDTLKRVVRSVKRSGYVLSTGEYNDRPGDQTRWYSIDYAALEGRAAKAPDLEPEDQGAESHIGADQNAKSHGHRGNLHPPEVQSAPPQGGNLHPHPIDPETTTETNAEKAGPPSGDSTPPESDQEPAPPNGGMFVRLFTEDLEGVRASYPDRPHRPVSGKWRKALKRAADEEIAAGRDPGEIRRGVSRLALRIDAYPGLELAEAINDVLDGKAWTVEQEIRAKAAISGDVPRGETGAERRREGYGWLFGEDQVTHPSGVPPPAPIPVEEAPEPEPERDPWEGSAFADVVPHDGWGDLAGSKVAAAIRARLLEIAGGADEEEYGAAIGELRAAPWVGDGFKESVVGRAEQLRRARPLGEAG